MERGGIGGEVETIGAANRRRRLKLVPARTDFLKPVASNQLVALGKWMDAVPDPLLRTHGFGCLG